ncbi:MAG: hypothetical protein JW828_08710 [Sedimentisphaerales bacterium]|nr:hypothetical protein [Sedimentisphaerales bacterium]
MTGKNIDFFSYARTRIFSILLILLPCYIVRSEPVVEVEEIITSVAPAHNGAGPLWCYGAPLVARCGEDVFVSVIETGTDVPPLCNTRWQLWHRTNNESWTMVRCEGEFRQREPCPVGVFCDQSVFLSVNPSTEPPGTQYGPCKPLVLEFDGKKPGAASVVHEPSWEGRPHFTDHSYRGFAADGINKELLLVNIDAQTGQQFVSFRDAQGSWHAKGKISFPIRSCYPQVSLQNRSAHILAIGDIVEPNEEWRKLKFEKLGRQWDYVFRRLFYSYTPDIRNHPFSEPIEVDSVEDTAGHIANLDLYVDSDGLVHVLYLRQPHQYAFLRDAYFPGQEMTLDLEYVVVRSGKAICRRTLAASRTDQTDGLIPAYARFHIDSRNRLHVVLSGTMKTDGKAAFGMFIASVPQVFDELNWMQIPLQKPLRTFFTNTVRGGSGGSDVLDLFGIADDGSILRYARIRLNDRQVICRTESGPYIPCRR